MRLNSAISLFMTFLIFSSGFVTICHKGEAKDSEVHLLAQPCETHECGRNTRSPSCAEEDCQHQFCSDQSIHDEYRHNGLTQLQALAAQPMVIENISLSEKQQKPFLSIVAPPHIAPLRTTVLRI